MSIRKVLAAYTLGIATMAGINAFGFKVTATKPSKDSTTKDFPIFSRSDFVPAGGTPFVQGSQEQDDYTLAVHDFAAKMNKQNENSSYTAIVLDLKKDTTEEEIRAALKDSGYDDVQVVGLGLTEHRYQYRPFGIVINSPEAKEKDWNDTPLKPFLAKHPKNK